MKKELSERDLQIANEVLEEFHQKVLQQEEEEDPYTIMARKIEEGKEDASRERRAKRLDKM